MLLYLATSYFPALLWLNLTDGEPIGLYRAYPADREIRRGELIVMAVPPEFHQYAHGQVWLPEG